MCILYFCDKYLSMSKYFLLLIVFSATMLLSCKNNDKATDPALQGLESAFNSNPSEETYTNLVSKYLEVIQNAKKEQDISGLLERASAAANKMNKPEHEILFLNNLVKSYSGRPDEKANIIKMIGLLHRTGKHTTADVLAYCYIKAYPGDPEITALKEKLPKESTPEAYIMEVGQSIFADTIKKFDESKAMAFVDACEAFAMVLPSDPQTSEYLFKAAETSSTLKTYEKSFALYDWIINKYPNSERAPIALFMKGFIFDGTLHDSANAAKYYTEFINKYPSSNFAKDAKVLLSNLGKSDEEVLEEIKAKGKQSN